MDKTEARIRTPEQYHQFLKFWMESRMIKETRFRGSARGHRSIQRQSGGSGGGEDADRVRDSSGETDEVPRDPQVPSGSQERAGDRALRGA